jgi:hypothetical protein
VAFSVFISAFSAVMSLSSLSKISRFTSVPPMPDAVTSAFISEKAFSASARFART